MSMSTTSTAPAVVEKPVNGLAGLRYWRQDVIAGLMVSLTSLPLSLGIAVASNAPPIAGLISAIIAGLLFPFLGGAYVTISGPAAGLAPALAAAIVTLGHGKADVGYPLLLAVICMVGVVQVILSRLGAAKLSAMFPVAVVEGMLASIGLMIIVKELGHFIGHKYRAHEFFGYILETPEELRKLDRPSVIVGMVCLLLLFLFSIEKVKKLLKVPPPLVVVVVGLILGQVAGVDADHLIKVPDRLTHGFVLPNFAGLFADPSLYYAIVATVLTLVMIDGVESLATIKAIDKIDPYKRRSDPDRTLMAMGFSNIASSLGGGLTIIPGGVKSKLCITVGGCTLWANFYNALFLILYILAGSQLINMIPYSALAAILIYTGFKMCEPKVWAHIAHIGKEQLLLFSFTVLVTLMTDLLVGILAGMALKLLLNVIFTSRHVWTRFGKPLSAADAVIYGLRHVSSLFGNPVVKREQLQDVYHLYIDRPLVCFNALFLNHELERIPDDIGQIQLHLGENVAMIDHTSYDTLMHYIDEHHQSGKVRVELTGLQRMRQTSTNTTGMWLADVPGLAVPTSIAEAITAETLAEAQPVD